MGRISVLIPDADEWLSLPVAYCLKTSGQITVHGFSRRKSRPLLLSRLFTSLEYTKEFELSSWLSSVDEVVARRGIDIVMPVSHLGIEALSEHRRALGCADKLVRLPEPRIFDTATNKASLAGFLAGNDLPHPRTVVVTADAPRPEGLSTMTFPILAKPPVSSGGAGIRRFENPKELELFLADQRDGQAWVLQEFIQGIDLGVNVLCQDGNIIASTVQRAIGPSSVRYAAATGVQFGCDPLAMNVARRLVEKLRWSGVANIDMRLGTQRETPLILEMNGRYWLTLLGSLRAGVNFPLLACETFLGVPGSNQRARRTRYFCGNGNVLLSLVGGGRHRVKPSETDFDYFVRDIVFWAAIQAATLVKLFRDKLVTPIRSHLRAKGR
jgi:D-aspartate ligase